MLGEEQEGLKNVLHHALRYRFDDLPPLQPAEAHIPTTTTTTPLTPINRQTVFPKLLHLPSSLSHSSRDGWRVRPRGLRISHVSLCWNLSEHVSHIVSLPRPCNFWLKNFPADFSFLHRSQGTPQRQTSEQVQNTPKPTTNGVSKRITTPHACAECKRRKIRCDGRQPCGQCLGCRSPKPCFYDKHRQRVIPSRKYESSICTWNHLLTRISGLSMHYLSP